MKNISIRCNGFTLIELLVAMAVSGIVAAAIFTVFKSQQDSYIVQEDVAAMQQNLRAGMSMLSRDVRMAGYDLKGTAGLTSQAFRTAGVNRLTVAIDLNEDGDWNDSGEVITYGFSPANDANADGIADNGIANLERNDGSGPAPVTEGIQAIGFACAYDSNNDGKLDTSSSGHILWAIDSNNDGQLDTLLDTNDDGVIDINDNPSGIALSNPVSIDQIRSVKIWLLARSRRPDRSYINKNTYVVANKRITPGDNYRRRLLVTTVTCRNMGL